ncbi:hypothetical protein DH2020_018958 [Rehmannia glutinosa]|uniref:Uncharacterized protein n=1 Tax=Rehmannia glutinosa TaxID=99300 RepID=A0ABR0WMB9_REHGL
MYIAICCCAISASLFCLPLQFLNRAFIWLSMPCPHVYMFQARAPSAESTQLDSVIPKPSSSEANSMGFYFLDACKNMKSESSLWRRRVVARFTAGLAVIFLLLIIGVYTGHGFVEFRPVLSQMRSSISAQIKTVSLSHRKLLNNVISQGPTEPLPNGIPTYTVEIMNVCVSGCDISAIHLTCGWFSSARLVNPRVFKRLRFDDCLVNDGKPLANGRTLSFQYANTFPYSLAVSSVRC